MENAHGPGGTPESSRTLTRYLSPLNVWALSLGCAVGWGAFVMPGTTFLPAAGPLGTALGLAVGAAVMMIIGINYHYLMNKFPDAGGTLTYAIRTFGYDHGFLCAWFLVLVYVAIIWANATALTLIARNLLGSTFQFGFYYRILGYDVYLGEALLSICAILLFGFLCIRSKRLTILIQTALALLLMGGVLIGAFGVLGRGGLFPGGASGAVTGTLSGAVPGAARLIPAFAPSGVPPVRQVITIVALAPWAFVGFESVSQSVEDFRFPVKRSLWILAVSLLTGGAAYILLSLMAAGVLPEGYDTWAEYVTDLENLSGHAALPVFHATEAALGQFGLALLGATVCAAIITGLVGNTIAASRLLCAMAQDRILPAWFGKLNRDGVPKNAIVFLMSISVWIPFLGRTAVGWIVDVNTIGAVIAYGYTSAAAYASARREGNRIVMHTGFLGLACSFGFFLYFMALSAGAMSTESYLILALWSILGFVFFRRVFSRDTARRFGKSTVVWLGLLFLIYFTTLMWVRQATDNMTREVIDNVSGYYEEMNPDSSLPVREDAERCLQEQMEHASRFLTRNSVIQMCLIICSLGIMFSLYATMARREQEMEAEKVRAEESSRAKTTFLSHMSHDIRTPMNAIIGYTNLAEREENGLTEVRTYLEKIKASSLHLLALINDVLEMSRIESGKMELEPVETDLARTMDEARDLFAAQMEAKNIHFFVSAAQVRNRRVLCDRNRLNRILLNLISNAYKFTPSGGSVTVDLWQLDDGEVIEPDDVIWDTEPPGYGAKGGMNDGAKGGAENGINGGAEDGGKGGVKDGTETGRFARYELRVKDSGIGMTKQFATRVFEAFEREKTSTVSGIQGTGLGMAITKNIVDMMGGSIMVKTAPGAGTEFVIQVRLPLLPDAPEAETCETPEAETCETVRGEETDFSGLRLLLVDDNDINREIASLLLEEAGFVIEEAVNGAEAVRKVSDGGAGYYDCVLMDVQMPVMNGYEAARAIRRLADPALARIPVIAMTANAFAEDIREAKEAGMDGHIAKPVDVAKMMETLRNVLRKGRAGRVPDAAGKFSVL